MFLGERGAEEAVSGVGRGGRAGTRQLPHGGQGQGVCDTIPPALVCLCCFGKCL